MDSAPNASKRNFGKLQCLVYDVLLCSQAWLLRGQQNPDEMPVCMATADQLPLKRNRKVKQSMVGLTGVIRFCEFGYKQPVSTTIRIGCPPKPLGYALISSLDLSRIFRHVFQYHRIRNAAARGRCHVDNRLADM